jgi:hypothetical protein
MSLNRKAMLGLLCAVSILSTSCASKRISGWFKSDDKITLSAKETKSLKKSVEMHWNKRHEKAELEKAISIYLTLSKSTVDNYDYLARLSRAYYFLADAHINEIEAKKKTWEIGTSYGEKAMAKNEAFAKAMTMEDAKVEDHLNKLSLKEVSAMYWTAANLGKWAKNSGIATTLKYKTLIKNLISNVQKHNPSFFYYAADRYWGAFYAVAPGFAGGSMPKSKKSFEKCIKAAPTYLGTKVLYAHYYMAKEDDKENFKKLLNEVVNSKVMDKNIYSENIIEKIKAKKLLSEVDEIF